MKKLSIKRLFQLTVCGIFAIVTTMTFLGIHSYISAQKNYNTQSLNLIDSCTANIQTVYKNIERLSTALSYDKDIQKLLSVTDTLEKNKLLNTVYKIITPAIQNNSTIKYIAVFNDDEVITLHDSTEFNGYFAVQYFQKNATDGFKMWNNNKKNYITLNRPLYDLSDKKPHRIGSILIVSDTKLISVLINNIRSYSGISIAVTDENKNIIASNVDIDLENKQYNFKVIENSDIAIAYKFNMFSQGQSFAIILLMLMGFIATVLFASFVATGIKIRVALPIEQLIDTMKQIGSTNLNKRIKEDLNPEFNTIAVYINEMLERIDDMTHLIFQSQERLYEIEIANRENAYNALKSQTSPHFLFNTLECIRSIATFHKISEIVQITLSLSNILRYSIKGDETATIDEEIKNVCEYLKIINIRFPDKIQFLCNVDNEIQSSRYIKMILQPIIENSVYHGLEMIEGNGTIQIEGKRIDNMTVLTVTDNGFGIDSEKLENLRKNISVKKIDNLHIGLNNINNRIKLTYGDEYGINIDSAVGRGTTVKIYLPNNTD